MTTTNATLALDVGEVRVGVALASNIARLPRPHITLANDDTLFAMIENIVEVESVDAIVVGFPRGMQGQDTRQTQTIKSFVGELKQHVALPIFYQDEAMTSKHARAELDAKGKPYDKGAVDALAATYILEDYLRETEHSAGVRA